MALSDYGTPASYWGSSIPPCTVVSRGSYRSSARGTGLAGTETKAARDSGEPNGRNRIIVVDHRRMIVAWQPDAMPRRHHAPFQQHEVGVGVMLVAAASFLRPLATMKSSLWVLLVLLSLE